MFQQSKKSKAFVFLTIISLILFFFINRKNIFIIFDNIETIKNKNLSLNEKKRLVEK